ncbi:MAG: hypothetical protein AB7L17_02590 [Ilumatobacteraceae bacterium]
MTIPAAPPSTTLDSARAQLVAEMPQHFDRLRCGSAQLRELQTSRLRTLLAAAIEHAPFHARRLAGIDPSTFDLADLASLPVMTKGEMMSAYDEIVTDRRLTRAAVEAHLSSLAEHPHLFADEYVVIASGGSSGERGIFAYHHTAAAEYVGAILRPGLAPLAAAVGWPLPFPVPITVVAAPVCVHATRILPSIADRALAAVTFAPATLPFRDLVERVQDAQPLVLNGYASTIARLADAQAAGDLSIRPQAVQVTSEQLTPDVAERIAIGFGGPPGNSFASSEGLIGAAPPGSDVFDFAGDLAIVEPVDADDRPVAPGVEAHHVLVTNLFNLTQPLIRYRLDDAMTLMPPAAHGHQRAVLQGRSDEHLRVAGVAIHPLTIRSVMVRNPGVRDFRVHADGSDVGVDVVADGYVDLHVLEGELVAALAAGGAATARVAVRRVDALVRDPRTGKARRFSNAER